MRRDMDLIRHILVSLEQRSPEDFGKRLEISPYETTLVSDHIVILKDGGYLLASQSIDCLGHGCFPIRLTWTGHDLLASIRDDTVWNRTVRLLARVGGEASIAMVKGIADGVTKQLLAAD